MPENCQRGVTCRFLIARSLLGAQRVTVAHLPGRVPLEPSADVIARLEGHVGDENVALLRPVGHFDRLLDGLRAHFGKRERRTLDERLAAICGSKPAQAGYLHVNLSAVRLHGLEPVT